MPKAPKIKWTEPMIFQKLHGKFPPPAFVLLPQCRSATGVGMVRTADVLGASVWPSRGLYLFGIEIKVSRSDWRKELATPEKADEIQQFCRHWYVAAPKGIAPLDEVPDTWGLLEITGRGVFTTKVAPEVKPTEPDVFLVAAILRAAAAASVSNYELKGKLSERYEQGKAAGERDGILLREAVAAFEDIAGVKIDRWDCGDVAAAVRMVRESGILSAVRQTEEMIRTAERVATIGHEALAKLKPERSDDEPITDNPA